MTRSTGLHLRPAVAGLTAVAAAVALVATADPAGAAAAPESITVLLRAPHPAALARLASATGLSRSQRLARLAALLPSAADHAAVAGTLRREGFTVGHTSAWSVTATGPATTVRALFGTRPALTKSGANLAAAAGTLPLLPAPLVGRVSAVYPTTRGPAPFRHMATSSLDGSDFRNADTPAGVAPSNGANDGGLTIATLQLADFYYTPGTETGAQADTTAADLTSFAHEHNLADPVADGQYQPVMVDGGPSTSDDATGGDVEVNLDQQSILSTAPSAKQHAYFAPNTNAGFADVFSAVLDDVTGNGDATSPDSGITALSISWGQCETGWGASEINAVEPLIESLVAAGVTVFAASGDDGIYDCGSSSGTGLDNSQADVDFPASSPFVVATGGSNLSAATSAPNDGTNWTETSWSCSDPISCQSAAGTGGTGGGASGSAYDSTSSDSFAGFDAPSYQTKYIDDAPFAGAGKRLVPDITADGDPSTGFVLYTSNPQYVIEGGGSHDVQVGGTSLASPISAAQLTNALGDSGLAAGVGDIHDELYRAYAGTESLAPTNPAKVFRDVVSGTNGAAADKGSDPAVAAQTGYDTNSGVGGVLWSALVPYLTHTQPTVTAALKIPSIDKATNTYRAVASWSAAAGDDPASLDGTQVRLVRAGIAAPVFTATSANGTHRFTAVPGATYLLQVTATDVGGGTASASSTRAVPIDDRLFAFGKTWHRAVSPRDVGGNHAVTSVKGATAKVSATGTAFFLRVHQGPKSGRLGVFRSGKRVATIDLYRAASGARRVRLPAPAARANRTFTLRALGTKDKKSTGWRVAVDALFVTDSPAAG